MEQRRTLTFASLDEVMPEVDRLIDRGHTRVGNWTLGQICNHLAMSFQGSIDGIPFRVPWIVQKTLGPIVKRQILGSGRMRAGIKLPDAARPRSGLDDRAEVEALRAALRVYAAHGGPLADHPMFGPMSRADWTRLHGIHCAHHLSFVLPNGN